MRACARRALVSAALFVAMALLASPAMAQEEDELQLLFGGSQKVSSGSKASAAEDARESATQVTVISGEEIRAFGFRTLSEVIQGAPECFVSSDRVSDVAGIRGFARDGDFNTRILILLDGHVLNEPWNNYVPIGTDLPIDFEQVERVEIISGPVSALYGSNAFFGAVNVVTRSPEKIGGGASYRSGSAGLNRAAASYGAPGILAWITGSTADGEAIRHPSLNASEQNTDWDRNGGAGLAISGGRVSFRAMAFARSKGLIGGEFGSRLGDNRNRQGDAHAFAEIAARVVDRKTLKIRARGYGDAYAYDDYLRYDPAPVVVDRASSMWGGAEVVVEWQAGPSALVVSMEDSFQRVSKVTREQKGTGTATPDPNSPANRLPTDVRRFNRARIAAEESLRMGAIGRAVAGLYVEDEDLYGVQAAPRAGLVLHPWRDGTLKALYQRGFRSPSVYERYFTDGESLAANPNLRSETVDGFDLSVVQSIGWHLELTASGFDAEYRNLILQGNTLDVPDGAGRTPVFQQYRNSESLRASGGTLRADWRSKAFTARADASAFARRTRGGDPVQETPDWLAHAETIVPAAGGTASIAARVTGIGPRLARDGSRLGAVGLADVSFRVNRLWKSLSLGAAVTNLFDARYANPVGDEYAAVTIPQPARRFFLEARWSYSPVP